MQRSLIQLIIISMVALVLSACGFVTAPITQGVAYAGKGTVKGIDTGMVYSKVAVKKAKDKAIEAREFTIEKFNPAPPQDQNEHLH
jgi:hypothetical protein